MALLGTLTWGDCHFPSDPSPWLTPPSLHLRTADQASFWRHPGCQSLNKLCRQFLISAATASADSSPWPSALLGGPAGYGVSNGQHKE